MAKGKKGGSSHGSCKFCNCADCKCKPKLLVALLVALSVLILAPSIGGDYQKSGLSSVLVTEDNASGGDTSGTDNGSTDSGAGDSGTNGDSGSGGSEGCAPGTTCDNTNGDTGNTNPPTNNYQPDNNWNSGDNSSGGDNWQQGSVTDEECKNDLRDAKRIVRELQQIIKKATKRGENTSEQSADLATAEEIYSALQSCTSLTREELNQYREALHGENSIQGKLDVYRCLDERERLEKETEREDPGIKHLNEVREIASEEWQAKIDVQLANAARTKEINERKLELMDSTGCKIWSWGEFPDEQTEFDDLNWEQQDLYDLMNDFWFGFQDVQEKIWATRMFTDIKAEIERAYEDEYPNMSPEMKAKFDEMAKIGLQLIEKGEACSADGDDECVKKVQMKLEEFGRMTGKYLGPPRDFKDLGVDDPTNENLKMVMENKSYGEASKVIEYLLSIDQTLMSKITDPTMLNMISNILGNMPQEMQGKVLEISGEIKDAYSEALETAPQLESYENDILGHAYVPEVASELIENLEAVRDGGMTVAEFVPVMEEGQELSKTKEVENGFAKFEDASTGTWFYNAAESEAFDIKGIDGQFKPENLVTFAEMLRVLLDATGEGKTDGETSYAGASGHWAEGYVKTAENRGDITLMELDRRLTRGEMAKLMVEVLGLPVDSSGNAPFTDLPGNKYGQYITTLYNYGVIAGDPDGKVRPNDTINRAEAFTLANNVVNELQFEIADTTGMSSWMVDIENPDIESSDWEVDFNDADFEEDNFGGDNWGIDDGGQGMGGGDYQPNDNYDYNNDLEETSDELNDLLDNLMDNVFSALRN